MLNFLFLMITSLGANWVIPIWSHIHTHTHTHTHYTCTQALFPYIHMPYINTHICVHTHLHTVHTHKDLSNLEAILNSMPFCYSCVKVSDSFSWRKKKGTWKRILFFLVPSLQMKHSTNSWKHRYHWLQLLDEATKHFLLHSTCISQFLDMMDEHCMRKKYGKTNRLTLMQAPQQVCMQMHRITNTQACISVH